MVLVDYSDSDNSDTLQPAQTHNKIKSPQGVKRKHSSISESILPPLPGNFHDLYASTARVSSQDDPTLHGGRLRVKPHVEGNWPTHVYVEWFPSIEDSTRLRQILTTFAEVQISQEHQVHNLLLSELGTELPLHISLSRPIILLAHQRQSFVDTLTHAIIKTDLSPFEVAVRGLEWVANYENTRWFLVLKLEKAPQDGLNKLLHLSNRTVVSFGQPSLYTNSSVDCQNRKSQAVNVSRPKKAKGGPSSLSVSRPGTLNDVDMSSNFHVSIGWTLSAPTQDMKQLLNTREISFQAIKVAVSTVKVKIGNGITAISLASKIDDSNKIIET